MPPREFMARDVFYRTAGLPAGPDGWNATSILPFTTKQYSP
jgi:hypothetical protein